MSSGRIELQLLGNGTIQTALGDRRKFRTVIFPAGPRGRDGAVSGSIAWTNVTGKPSTFPPSSHTHTPAEVGADPAGSAAAAQAAAAVDATSKANAAQSAAEATAATALAAHVSAADPHTGYQLETEKGVANGYASLDGDGKVPSGQLPSVGGGKLVNRWVATSTTVVATTTSIPLDDTIPQNTEGAELMTVSVTPSSAANKLKVTVAGWLSTNGGPTTVTLALFVGSTASAVATAPISLQSANRLEYVVAVFWVDSFSGTQTVALRGGDSVGNTFRWLAVNVGLNVYYGATDPAILLVEEIAP